MVLILETLSIVCRETEIVPTRVEIMKYEAGRITQQLIRSLITCPEVPAFSMNISETLENSSELTMSEIETDREVSLYICLLRYNGMLLNSVYICIMKTLLSIKRKRNILEFFTIHESKIPGTTDI